LNPLGWCAGALLVIAGSSQVVADDAQVVLGHQVYDDRCAACHGAKLEGQPNWMKRLPNGRLPAPPHDASGHTWHHSDEQLFSIVKEGLAVIAPGYETDMPAFGIVLTDDEIWAVLEFIKSTWPDREREHQRARTQAP
jgi:mono/diheme cytochrome c family protein